MNLIYLYGALKGLHTPWLFNSNERILRIMLEAFGQTEYVYVLPLNYIVKNWQHKYILISVLREDYAR